MNDYLELTDEVVRISEMDFSGNIIPNEWFEIIKLDSGKPDLNSIIILSEIIYWYRWTEVRDNLGRTMEYRKKFQGKYLQKSYKQLSEKFGLTERQVKDSIVRLEKAGYLERIFETVQTEERSLPNVMHIKINPTKIELSKKRYRLNDPYPSFKRHTYT